MIKTKSLPALGLTVALQLLPLTRLFIASTPSTVTSYAVVSTWIAGAVALLGGFNAVSGASTRITSATSAKATNGVPFSYRITTGPEAANRFQAAPLPSGLAVSTSTGRITGTPTVTGVFTIRLTASDSGISSRTVTANLVLTIVEAGPGGSPPSITRQPISQTISNGGNVTLTVAAAGTAPFTYQWRRDGANVAGATSASLTLSAVSTNKTGRYTALVSNAYGSVTSSVATVSLIQVPRFSTFSRQGNQLVLTFTREAGSSYEILSSDTLSPWTPQSVTNWPPASATATTSITVPTTAGRTRFYQIKMLP